jgi:starvation-inducible DNA-binding protein
MKTNQTYINRLNDLLSTYQVHYQNLRSLHWNILGTNFFELHTKYEQLYNRVQVIIDDLAERILTVGGLPLSKLKDYLKNSLIEENELIRDGEKGINYILSAQKEILIVERELLKLSAELDDEGTNAFLSDLIKEKEKINWMLSAWSVKQTEIVF